MQGHAGNHGLDKRIASNERHGICLYVLLRKDTAVFAEPLHLQLDYSMSMVCKPRILSDHIDNWQVDVDWLAAFEAHLQDIDLVSFDVFDTAITRLTDAPVDVFALAEARLIDSLGQLARGFAEAREMAEIDARRLAGSKSREDITFDEIYAALPYRLPGAERYLERFKKAELDAEVELLRGVPDILEAAKLAQAAGKTVVFVSDMYLPAATISQFLEECGYPKGLPVLVSSGTGCTKASGRQWAVLRRLYGASVRILHIGDDAWSDAESPRRHGIKTFPFVRTQSNRRLGGPLCPAVLPFSRAARLVKLHGGTDERPRSPSQFMADFGSAWGAVVVGSFVRWLEQRVQRLGIEHIVFCARDGWLLQQAWEAAGCGFRTGIRATYLYVSRRALNLAATAIPGTDGGLTEQALDFLCGGNNRISVRTFLERAGLLTCEALRNEAASELGGLDAIVPKRKGRETLRRLLRLHQHEVLAALALQREAALGYLAAQKLNESRIGIVDIGWHGNLQGSLVALLRDIHPSISLYGFYYGLWPLAQRRRPYAGWMEGAFGNDFIPMEEQRGLQNAVAILENLHVAPEGSTIGYRKENEKYAPILQESPLEVEQHSTLIAPFQTSTVAAIRELFESGQVGGLKLEDLTLAAGRAAIERLALSPTAEELNVLGGIRHASDFDHTTFAPLVPHSMYDARGVDTDWPIGAACAWLLRTKHQVERQIIIAWLQRSLSGLDARTLRQFS